ncbi:phage portal protein [Virgibacillus halophilus]|uniref:Phage portal protein n=1 Tax=Tigheibacillus halophilus TaxID=361280 RepID=A0ABU5CBS4_9BACI|nr:phage portal protein [Virgibacillus halophilus]
MTYQEHSKQGTSGQSVDEINKMTDGFLDQVCHAVGVPPNLLKGDMADIEKTTRNAMKFCIDPIITIIGDELNMQFVDEMDYRNGDCINIKRISYRDMFDIAVAVDKLRSSSVVNGHELRDAIGLEYSDDPIHDEFIMTKNYEGANDYKGGEED